MTIFYHVSRDLEHNGAFYPRIPTSTLSEGEDVDTSRICVSPTIESCFTAFPSGGKGLEELIDETGNLFKLFIIDTEALNISDDQIISSQTLYEEDKVRDACITNESWILTPFSVPNESQKIIRILDWELVDNYHISYSIASQAIESGMDAFELYEEMFDEEAPLLSFLQNVTYLESDVEKNQEVILKIQNKPHQSLIIEYICKNYKVAWIAGQEDELRFQAMEDTDLTELFLYEHKLKMQNQEIEINYMV